MGEPRRGIEEEAAAFWKGEDGIEDILIRE